MARVEIKTAYPFTAWDARTKRGSCSYGAHGVWLELVKETARTKAGMYPFIVSWYADGNCVRKWAFTSIDEALAHMNRKVREIAMASGWTPEQE